MLITGIYVVCEVVPPYDIAQKLFRFSRALHDGARFRLLIELMKYLVNDMENSGNEEIVNSLDNFYRD